MTDLPNEDTAKKTPGGKPGRSGPPRGNLNAARHYLKAGKLPAKLQYVEHRINGFRRHLEEAVAKAKGEVSLVDAAAINSACKWERHGILAQHWLRHAEDEAADESKPNATRLSMADRLKYSEAIAKASDSRDKCLRLLGLDIKPEPVSLQTLIVEAKRGRST